MGLFSSKKIITVSSTLYNMAGDERDRPDFLKGTLFSSIISNSDSISDDMRTSYFEGPGMKQRQFFRYCDRNDLSGLPSATIVNTITLDPATVEAEIPPSASPPAPAGLNLRCFSAGVTDGDFEPWIKKWINLNHPTRIGEEWLGEFDPNTNTFSVEFPNNDFFSWANNGTVGPVYNSNERYVVGEYIEYLDTSEQPVVEGTVNSVTTLPDLTGFTETQANDTFVPVTLTRVRNTVLSYNNGDPDNQIETDVPANVPGQVPNGDFTYEREIVVDAVGISVNGERQIWNIDETHHVTNDYVNVVVTTQDLGGGVIETRTETTTGEQVTERWDTRYDTQVLIEGEQYGPEQIYIYQVGTGNTNLDALVVDADTSGLQQEFFPFMPVRINNVSIEAPQYAALYEEMSKAYRRGFGYDKKFSKLVGDVENNPSIDDIDYAYLCFGASLNVKEHACRRYIYKFFETMIPFQNGGSGNAMSDLQTQVTAYNNALNDLRNWETTVNSLMNGESWGTLPPRPTIPSISPPPTNSIVLKDGSLGFDIRTLWVHAQIEQLTGNIADQDPLIRTDLGLVSPADAKVDDIVLIPGPSFSWTERESYNTRDGEEERTIQKSIPSMEIYWQVGDNQYRKMTVWGLTHYNYIYGGKAVVISSTEALNDTEESGFLIPLHYPTMDALGIVDYTQMSTANSHILFNSYEVTKQRWYERGIFKILLVIAIIIVAVVLFPGAFAAGGGILGGNLAIGTALGLTGTAAIVAGVVANYVASIIIAEVLKIVGTTLFGEKWGAVFAAIAGFAFGMAMTGTSLFSAQGLLGFANAAANAYSGYVQGDILEMQEDLEDDRSDYEREMDRIQDLLAELTSSNGLNFNPMSLMDSSRNTGSSRGYLPETLDGYISRTTMTGTDIVDLTLAMVNDYAEIQRTLPRN